MTFEQLYYFVEIYNMKSLRRASEVLNITHQSLSSSIKNLEKELDLLLFEKTKKGVTATRAGKDFYKFAIACLNEFDIFKNNNLPHKTISNCRIAYLGAFNSVIAQLYTLLFDKFPTTIFSFEFIHANEWELAYSRKYDIIFNAIYESDTMIPPKEYTAIYLSSLSDANCVWVNANSHLAKYKTLTYTHLKNYTLLLLDRVNFSNHPVYDNVFKIQRMHSSSLLLATLKNPHSNTFTMDMAFNKKTIFYPELLNDPNVVLKPLPLNNYKLDLVLVYKNNYQEFVYIIKDFLLKILS